jgi:heparanase 1
MLLDAVSWHYYPQQSRRSPVAVRRASPVRALRASFLGESLRWARWVRGFRDRYAPGAELWLEEAGNAQCGGEPGLSDRFAAGFWWLDLLGQMAAGGHQVVMRHNLSGADYGLLSAESLESNPDYWNSLLWRRLMGTEVLEAGSTPTRPDLRLYAHRTRGKENSVTVLALNISRRETLCLDTGGGAAEIYLLSAPRLLGRELFLNGRRLAAGKDGSLPALEPRLDRRGIVELPPASYAFVVLDRSFG